MQQDIFCRLWIYRYQSLKRKIQERKVIDKDPLNEENFAFFVKESEIEFYKAAAVLESKNRALDLINILMIEAGKS